MIATSPPTLMRFTPSMAKEYLDQTDTRCQRPVNRTHVNALARKMEAGEFNGQRSNDMIMIGRGGNIINGQHRAHAIVQSGIAQDVWVRLDVDDAAFEVIDIDGRARGLGDRLAVAGVVPADLAAPYAAYINYISKILWNSEGKNLRTVAEAKGVFETYRESINWMHSAFTGFPPVIRNSGKLQTPHRAAFVVSHLAYPMATREFVNRYTGVTAGHGVEDPAVVLSNARGVAGNKKETALVTSFKTLKSLALAIAGQTQKNVSGPSTMTARFELLTLFTEPKF
jgi:hypothetical protein